MCIQAVCFQATAADFCCHASIINYQRGCGYASVLTKSR